MSEESSEDDSPQEQRDRCILDNEVVLDIDSNIDLINADIVVSNIDNFRCEERDGSNRFTCRGNVTRGDDISTISAIFTINSDNFDILTFDGQAPCFDEKDTFEITFLGQTVEFECDKCDNDVEDCELDLQHDFPFEIFELLKSSLRCPEVQNKENLQENDNNNLFGIIVLAMSIVLFTIVLIVFIFRRRNKQRQKNLLENTEQPRNMTPTSPKLFPSTTETRFGTAAIQPKPMESINSRTDLNELAAGPEAITTLTSNRRKAMASFNTKRESAFSFASSNTAWTFKSEISQADTNTQNKVRSVIAADSQKFSVMSGLISMQINRLSLNTIENDNLGEDFNEKLVESAVVFLKSLMSKSNSKDRQLLNFNVSDAPNISLKFYISRLMQGLNDWYYVDESTPEVGVRCLLLSLLYMSLVPTNIPDLKITKLNVYKLLATFMLISAKFSEDDIISNMYWGDVCGYSGEEVNELEQLLCFEFGFEFVIDPDDLSKMFLLFEQQQVRSWT